MGQISVEKSIKVDAPISEIWEQMVDVNAWPQWKPFIPKAVIGAGYQSLTNGSKIKFSIIMGGPVAAPLTVKVTEFDAPNRLAWTGGVPGLQAVHSFDFKETGGKTLVTSKEKFVGPLTGILKLIVSEQEFENLHQQWVEAIKKRVEKNKENDTEAKPDQH